MIYHAIKHNTQVGPALCICVSIVKGIMVLTLGFNILLTDDEMPCYIVSVMVLCCYSFVPYITVPLEVAVLRPRSIS